ncbi:signal peptidase I [Friedmanniella endophytica]|uniref:Signal peptidase I n=1 Tax=Microlunatus kandeliicorticis TaxID=1759536 RepID=A0A7W3IU15_9ACTN|nr:LamG-like jellyroll fold domain-containing protein [Microlunatus kandeliicorticis]MBA8795234.1 signal peptidase I [Microlunatus kandeliicorticis]
MPPDQSPETPAGTVTADARTDHARTDHDRTDHDRTDHDRVEHDPAEHPAAATGERLPGWPELLGITLARAVLAALLSLAAWAAVPALIGWHPTTVMTGSMMPRLHVGDVAVSRPLHGRAPTLGTVLLFDDPDHPGRLRLHRFVAVDPEGRIVTKGDANPQNDSSPITAAAVRGVGTLRVPFLGLPVLWIRTGDWLPLGLTVAGLIGLIALAGRPVVRRTDDEARDGHDDGADNGDGADNASDGADRTSAEAQRRNPAPHPTPTGGRPVRRMAAAVTATTAAAVLLTAVGVPAGAAFSDTTDTSADFAALPYFTCASAVVASSPWVYYRMDETLLSVLGAVDSSGNNRTGTYSSTGRTTQQTRACTRDSGYAMSFNGSNGSLSSPLYNAAPPNTFTVAIWFKTTTTKGGKLIGWGNSQTGLSGTYDRHLYLTNAGAVVFGVYPGAVRTVSSATGLNDGKWHQAVGTLSPAGQVLYVDGVQVAADPSTTSAEQASSSGYWRIGYDNLANWTNTPTSNYFSGTLDDAAVYLTALSATTVRNQYLAGT